MNTLSRKFNIKGKLSIKMLGIPLSLSIFYYLHNTINRKIYCDQINYIKIQIPDNINEGEMKEIKYGKKAEESILVIKKDNEIHALSNVCPHYGAPMSKGLLFDTLIKCPWHGASFDIKTGACDLAPSMDGLFKYDVIKEGNILYALVSPTTKIGKTFPMSKRDPNNTSRYIIIGGGPAGLSCAETLRQAGFTGEITIYTDEPFLPYDRPSLSKNLPSDFKKIQLRDDLFLKTYNIDVLTNRKVIAIDNIEKSIKLANGDVMQYDKLLVATGSFPKVPFTDNIKLKNVYTLRSFSDIMNIKNDLSKFKNISIIGASFIGMELAGTIKKAYPNAQISVIDPHSSPFEDILGKGIGEALQRYLEKNGVKFFMNRRLIKLLPEKGSDLIGGIEINSEIEENNPKNEIINTDLVLLGTGVIPNTEIFEGVLTMDGNWIKCDFYMNTSDPHIYAAGDNCSYNSIQNGERIRFPHVVNAQQQGAIAALNMLGKHVKYDYVPFFWTRINDKSLQYVGYAPSFEEVFIDGNLQELEFKAWFINNDKVVAFAAMNSPNSANIMYEVFRTNFVITAKSVKTGAITIDQLRNNLLQKVSSKCSKVSCLCQKN